MSEAGACCFVSFHSLLFLRCMKKTLLILACIAAASAVPAAAKDLPSCNRACSPEEWSSLSLQEKAEMWSALSREARHRIWSFMTDDEKRALRDKLRPIQKDKIRRRYDCIISSGSYPPAAPLMGELTPNERQHLRRQIIEVHMEFQQRRVFVPQGAEGPGSGSRR